MLKLIECNPFRILGVCSNASLKDITANKTKLTAYSKVGKSVDFPIDCVPLLGSIKRDEQEIIYAEHELTLPENKIKHALFWFVNDSAISDVALANINDGSPVNIGKATDILHKKSSFSSWINLSTISLIQGDIEKAISSMLNLVSDKSYCLQFSSAICGDNYKITPEQIWGIYIDELIDSVGIHEVYPAARKLDEDGEFFQLVEQHCIKHIVDKIQQEISASRLNKDESPEAHFRVGKMLIANTKELVEIINTELDPHNVLLQSACDDLATQILQCGINFYNGSDDPFEAKKAMQLQEYAENVAVGKLVKDRCKRNTDILRKIISELPPIEIKEEWSEIHKYLQQAKNYGNAADVALNILKHCAPILLEAKERLGASNAGYIQISTIVANAALSKIIDEVNAKISEMNNSILGRFVIEPLKKALRTAWEVIKSIECLDTTRDFRSARLVPNKTTLLNLISKVDLNVAGVVSAIDMRTDDEIFKACKDKESYDRYCKRFPNGKHYKEAQDKISLLENREKRTKKILWSIIIVIVLAIAGFITWSVLTADDRTYENARNNKQLLTNYLKSWPDGKHRDEAISDIYAICKQEGIASLYKFSEDYSSNPLANEAKQKVNAICDSLYNVANSKRTLSGWDEYAAAVPSKYQRDYEKKKQEICDSLYKLADAKHTLEAWDEYAAKVPYKYQKDYQKKKQEIRDENERKKWKNESSAWSAASSANTIDMYNKYLEFHPYGVHAAQAKKRVIDLRVSNVLAGNYGSLPEMDRTYYGGGTTSSITVHNDTGYTLTLLYSGSSQSKEIIISAGGYKTFSLANGYYRVVASVNAARVSNYAGNEQLSGGGYEVTYYIVTHRF